MSLWLVDTSVWVHHLAHGNPLLATLLERNAVRLHPFILGELALGNLRARAATLALLRNLGALAAASDDEVLALIEARRLYGHGIGYVDAHLLASALLLPGTGLWTLDRRLHRAAAALGVATGPPSNMGH